MTSDELQRDIAQIRQLRAQTSRLRFGLTATFIVITIISSLVLWCSFSNLSQDGPPKQQFVEALTDNMQQNVIPDAIGIGKDAVGQINIQEEFSKLNTRAPDVANAATEQVKLLAKNLPDQTQQTLDSTFDSVMKDREAKLKAEFPQATDEQLASLMTGITGVAHDQVSILTDSLFTPDIDTLNGIVGDLNKIQSEESPSQAEMPTWQMVFLISDLARSDLSDLQAQADASTKASDDAARKADALAAALKKKKS